MVVWWLELVVEIGGEQPLGDTYASLVVNECTPDVGTDKTGGSSWGHEVCAWMSSECGTW